MHLTGLYDSFLEDSTSSVHLAKKLAAGCGSTSTRVFEQNKTNSDV